MRSTTYSYNKSIGISLILMALFGGIGYGYAYDQLYIQDDLNRTIKILLEKPYLLQLACGCFIVILFLDIYVSFALYKHYFLLNRRLSLLTSVLRFVYSVILAIAIVSMFKAYLVDPNLNDNHIFIFKNLGDFLTIWSWGLIVFGLHLFSLGCLLRTSRQAPALIYILLWLGGACYVCIHSIEFYIPQYTQYNPLIEKLLSVPMALSELAFAFWMFRTIKYKNILS